MLEAFIIFDEVQTSVYLYYPHRSSLGFEHLWYPRVSTPVHESIVCDVAIDRYALDLPSALLTYLVGDHGPSRKMQPSFETSLQACRIRGYQQLSFLIQQLLAQPLRIPKLLKRRGIVKKEEV